MEKKHHYNFLEEHLERIKEELNVEMLKKFTDGDMSIEDIEKSLLGFDIPSQTRAEIVVFVLEHSQR